MLVQVFVVGVKQCNERMFSVFTLYIFHNIVDSTRVTMFPQHRSARGDLPQALSRQTCIQKASAIPNTRQQRIGLIRLIIVFQVCINVLMSVEGTWHIIHAWLLRQIFYKGKQNSKNYDFRSEYSCEHDKYEVARWRLFFS